MWFICNGESLIDAGRSILARLDTVTGALREYVLPGSKPAGFWRAPDGRVWIPQTDGRLQSLDLATLQVTDYRSRSADGTIFTFAYSGVAPGPDGALWMTDFGNNRIVRYEPDADTETSWTFLDPIRRAAQPVADPIRRGRQALDVHARGRRHRRVRPVRTTASWPTRAS